MKKFSEADPVEGSEESIEHELERQAAKIKPAVSDVLRERRLCHGYSLEDLAIATGLTVQDIEAVEHDADVEGSNARRIAAVLNVSMDDYKANS